MAGDVVAEGVPSDEQTRRARYIGGMWEDTMVPTLGVENGAQ